MSDPFDQMESGESAPRPNLSPLPQIDFSGELNDEQLAAVQAPDGPALVLAGAGSGKTRTLTYRVAWLLAQGVEPWQILLLTFTNKAAKEMLGRVEELTGVPRWRFWGGTFHHVGMKTLRANAGAAGLESNFSLLDQGDSESLLAEVVRETDAQFLKTKDFPKARLLYEVHSYARNTQNAAEDILKVRLPWLEQRHEQILGFFAAYTERKRARNLCDYDDLLERWLHLLQEHPQIAAEYSERFRYVLVDEYQDTNVLQSSLVDAVGAHHNIMAVGDDAQCIYTWRGAEIENILAFPDRHPGTTVYRIETNYRSTPQILTYANDILSAQPAGRTYFKELRPVRPSRERPFVLPLMDTKQQAHVVIQRIERLVEDEGRRLSDIAVLYRAHFHALDLQLELTRRGVPFQITSGLKFFEQAHVKDVVAQVHFVHNPLNSAAFQRMAGLLPKVGEKTAQRLHALVVKELEGQKGALLASGSRLAFLRGEAFMAKVPKDAKEEWESLALTLEEIDEALHARDPQEVCRAAIEGWYGTYLKTLYANYLTRQDDLEGLVEFAARYDDVDEFLAQLVLLNGETSEKSVEIGGDALRLTTIHQAKGLEYPVVFVIGLADGLFPLNRAIENGDVEEERRLFYVAVTRAQDELYLAYPMLSGGGGRGVPMRNQPSRFLNEADPAHYEVLRVSGSTGW